MAAHRMDAMFAFIQIRKNYGATMPAKKKSNSKSKSKKLAPAKKTAVRRTSAPRTIAPQRSSVPRGVAKQAASKPFAAKPTVKPSVVVQEKPIITSDQIARRAYEISMSGTGGSEFDNWLRAERELNGW
jgi:hypothetical protein